MNSRLFAAWYALRNILCSNSRTATSVLLCYPSFISLVPVRFIHRTSIEQVSKNYRRTIEQVPEKMLSRFLIDIDFILV